ncbi:MAG TPA: Ig-like domain-containing protein [Nocardioides sp.]|uniref:Ig-like domain-containing protein n=1 Tax=Nocardioides sp. TaxID=35761 RepID=UPI002E33EE78|nr:Ig-like domain-containing protein [Nocardioides sp.]HEX5090097.1 Ig-like domain-containing protein [Nocardioides sp.]
MGKKPRVLVSVVASVVLIAAALGIVLSRGGGSDSKEREREAEARGASHEMREALEKHSSLRKERAMPLAFTSEKLAQASGDPEATGEIRNGPNQESYDERAYPRKVIEPAQQRRSASAADRIARRAQTNAGRDVLAETIDSDAAAPSTWTAVGPNGGLVAAEATYTGKPAHVSGRTTALATTGACTPASCTLYAGTAGGGLWKSSNALAATPTWTSVGTNLPSNAIGSITIGADGSVWVGTGEPNGSSDSEAGLGLFKSTDGGVSFTKVNTQVLAGDFTINRSVGAVAIDPNNPQHILVGTAVARHGSSSVNGGRFTPPGAPQLGLYETTNGGGSWTLALSEMADSGDPTSPTGGDFFRAGISKIEFDPTHAGVAYASMFDYGLYRATSAGGAWTRIYSIHNPGAVATSSTNRVEFATASLPGGATRIYLGDATEFGDAVSGLLRTDDATAATPSWTALSSATKGTPGYGSYNFCQGQCSYDMVVTSPPGLPDEVFLSGSMNYDELEVFGGPGSSNGRAVVRSADAGAHFTDMTNDVDDNGLHPDHHALVFVDTGGAETFFTASDGGVVRENGPYVDRSADCDSRPDLAGPDLADCQQFLSAIPTNNDDRTNVGLQTLQYQSVSIGSNSAVQGGTQDNGTWESDQAGFSETVGGDGGQSGFDHANPAIRFHSYFNPQHDVSFDNGSPTSWDWISDPFNEASSFYTPLTVDPVTSGTVFNGLRHIWRTTDNGGPQAYLDEHCNELTGDFSVQCGDWVTLGGAAGDLSGGNAANYVVAVERAPSNASTLWAGTRLGRIYVSPNANAASADAVTYTRLDQSAGLPQRFPSSIAIDPANPNHAYISYSGYSAYSPGGHVYDVTFNPGTGTATATDLSANLGDQPITDVVYVPATKSLFASTDYGVVTRSTTGSGGWVGTQGLPVVAVYGLTYDAAGQTLYAATHGRSVWKLSVTPAPPSATTVTASAPKKVKSKKPFNVSATVASSGGTPTGTVQVFDGSKLIGTGTLAGGTVTIRIAKGLKKKGVHTLTVKYLGTADFSASQTTVKVKVTKKKKHHHHHR